MRSNGKGKVTYKKRDFKPSREFHLASFRDWVLPGIFDAASCHLPENFNIAKLYPDPIDSLSMKVLKNYPFAKKGYVFKNKELQSYFERQSWYTPNDSYKASLDSLSEEESEWVLRWSK